MAVIGPVANGPAQTTATIAQQADAKFFKTNKVSEKVLPDRILTSTSSIIPTDKFRLGTDNKIDTTINFDTGEWKGAFHLKGIVADTGTRVYSSYLDREFKFTDGEPALQSMEFSGDSLAWLGLMGDVASIKMTSKVLDADGKLTMTLTATDPFSKVRKLVFNDGQPLEIHYNDGINAMDSSCIVQFLNVERPLSGDVTFTLRLVKDFEASGGVVVSPAKPLTYQPNLNLWVPMEKGEKSWPLNYMELTVQDTVKFMLATYVNDGGGKYHYDYTKKEAIQALFVNVMEGYIYLDRKDPYFNHAGNVTGTAHQLLKQAVYELGMRDSTGNEAWIYGKSYVRDWKTGSFGLGDSTQGRPIFIQNPDPPRPMILMGDLSKNTPPNYTPDANWFVAMESNNMRKETFVLRFARNSYDNNQTPFDSGSGVIGFRFEKAANDAGLPYYLKDGRMDYGSVGTNYKLTTTGHGTDTVYANNQRVTVLDNRHIKIIDNNPVSWAGERYYSFNGVLRPYDTATPVGVNEQPVEIYSPDISVYPNPIMDGVMNIKLNKPVEKDIRLYLYTPLGQKVEEIPIRAGEQEGHIYLEGLASGVYWLKEERYGLPVVIINK